MNYYIRDLLSILMQIELNFERLYKNVSSIEGQYNNQLRTAAIVLSKQEKMHAQWYDQLISEGYKNDDYVLDSAYYQSALKMLVDFKAGIQKQNVGNINDLLTFAIYYEKLNAETLKRILEGLDENDNPQLFELLNKLIVFECEHSSTLERFQRQKQ